MAERSGCLAPVSEIIQVRAPWPGDRIACAGPEQLCASDESAGINLGAAHHIKTRRAWLLEGLGAWPFKLWIAHTLRTQEEE